MPPNNHNQLDNYAMETSPPKPFLRWAGGKRWLAEQLKELYPQKFNKYYEPFLGGGSVFFNLPCYDTALLSDLNEELIETYTCVRDNVEPIIEKLKEFQNTKESYYKIRKTEFKKPQDKAAQFIFLNRTSFNGIYRVNKQGVYNVPYGNRQSIDIIQESNLRLACLHLKKADLVAQDFGKSLSKVKEGDLVYIDPPYTVAHEHNGFILYNQKLFSLADQQRLAKWLRKIDDRGAYYILSNAKHEAIKSIYGNVGKLKTVKRKSLVGGKGALRDLISEYLVTNL